MITKNLTFTTKGGDYNSWALDQLLLYVKNGIEEKTNWKYVKSIQFADIVIFSSDAPVLAPLFAMYKCLFG